LSQSRFSGPVPAQSLRGGFERRLEAAGADVGRLVEPSPDVAWPVIEDALQLPAVR